MSDRDSTVDWLLSTQGRLARIALGTVLILFGLAVVGGFLGILLLIIGAVPIASAAYGTLLIGPLFGRDIHGRRPEQQRAEEERGEGEADADDDGGEAREDESEAETGGERRGEEPAEEPQEQLEKDATGSEKSSGGEGSGGGQRSGGGDEGIAPPLARAERPPGQGPRTKDVTSELGSGSEEQRSSDDERDA